jgi:hypothetical protein
MPEWLMSRIPDGWSEWHVAAAATAFAVVSAVVSLTAVGWVLARLPADYFVNRAARGTSVRHPVLRVLWIVLRNLIGYALIALGVVLSLPGVPGQGVLTILMGVMLTDFPGKFGVERWLVSRRAVSAAVNRLRAKLGRPPLITTKPDSRTSVE